MKVQLIGKPVTQGFTGAVPGESNLLAIGPQGQLFTVMLGTNGAASVPFNITSGIPTVDANLWGGLECAAAVYMLNGDSSDVVPQKMNGGTPSINADVTVTNATTTLAAANLTRRSLLLQNNGSEDVWLDFDGTAVAGAKLKLAAGATMSFSGESCPSTELDGITASGSSAVFVLET